MKLSKELFKIAEQLVDPHGSHPDLVTHSDYYDYVHRWFTKSDDLRSLYLVDKIKKIVVDGPYGETVPGLWKNGDAESRSVAKNLGIPIKNLVYMKGSEAKKYRPMTGSDYLPKE